MYLFSCYLQRHALKQSYVLFVNIRDVPSPKESRSYSRLAANQCPRGKHEKNFGKFEESGKQKDKRELVLRKS